MKATEQINQTANGPGVSTTDRVGSNKLGKDEFVKLLLAQLGNQDPTSPMDSQAFVAQLAQFSSLEQLNTVNEHLDSLLLAQSSTSQTAATSFVGKEAVFKTDKLQLQPEGSASATGTLAEDSATAAISVVDASGKTVRTVQVGPHGKGDFTFQWDGRNDAGIRQPAGEYTMRATAADKNGKSITVDLRTTGVVGGVSFKNGYPELLINGSKVKMSEVIEINQRSTP